MKCLYILPLALWNAFIFYHLLYEMPLYFNTSLQAYLSLMKGGLYFEQENWKAAMEYYTKAKWVVYHIKQMVQEIQSNMKWILLVSINFITWSPLCCRTIYEKLGSAFTEDIQQLYLQQVEEITPNIRYCAYNIGDQSAIDELRQLRRKGGEDQLTSHLDVILSIWFYCRLTLSGSIALGTLALFNHMPKNAKYQEY